MIGNQLKDDNRIQKLFTTLDIASNAEKEIQANVFENAGDIDEHNRILCIYQDLNGNIYDFIISINTKTKNNYDFFAYQRSSHSYRKWINENKVQYKSIYKNTVVYNGCL